MNLNLLTEAIHPKWKVKSTKYGAVCVPYIDARDVIQLLNKVVGVDKWQRDHKEVNGRVLSGIGIKIGEEWVWKWDVGSFSESQRVEKDTKDKGEFSDSFKRAAVNWGIGCHLYQYGTVKLPTCDYVTGSGSKKTYPSKKKNVKETILWDGAALTSYINNEYKRLPKPDVGVMKGEVLTMEVWKTETYQNALIQYTKQGYPANEIIKRLKSKFTGGISPNVLTEIKGK